VKAFRFRAQAALDLRARELEEAQRELARAEARRAAAQAAVEEATWAAAQARTQAAGVQREGGSVRDLEWYRFWILRLDHERAALAAALAAREHDVARVTAACLRARQRRESLERFKQKARAAYDAAELAAERKVIDELAARRFAITRRGAQV
jgi:flagellar export protein FliJ